jgi:hypothetical protein
MDHKKMEIVKNKIKIKILINKHLYMSLFNSNNLKKKINSLYSYYQELKQSI